MEQTMVKNDEFGDDKWKSEPRGTKMLELPLARRGITWSGYGVLSSQGQKFITDLH